MAEEIGSKLMLSPTDAPILNARQTWGWY